MSAGQRSCLILLNSHLAYACFRPAVSLSNVVDLLGDPEVASADLASAFLCLALCRDQLTWGERELALLETRILDLLRPSEQAVEAACSALLLLQALEGAALAHLLIKPEVCKVTLKCLSSHPSSKLRGRCALALPHILRRSWIAVQNLPFLSSSEFEGGGEAQIAWQRVVDWVSDVCSAVVHQCLGSDVKVSSSAFAALCCLLATAPLCTSERRRTVSRELGFDIAIEPQKGQWKCSWDLQGLEEIVLRVSLPLLRELMRRQRELGGVAAAVDACSALVVAAIKLSTPYGDTKSPVPCPLLYHRKNAWPGEDEEVQEDDQWLRHGCHLAIKWAHESLLSGGMLGSLWQEEAASAAGAAFDLVYMFHPSVSCRAELCVEAARSTLRVLPAPPASLSHQSLLLLGSAVLAQPWIPRPELPEFFIALSLRLQQVSCPRARIRMFCDMSIGALCEHVEGGALSAAEPTAFIALSNATWLGPFLEEEFWGRRSLLREEGAAAVLLSCQALLAGASRTSDSNRSMQRWMKAAIHLLRGYAVCLDWKSATGFLPVRAYSGLLSQTLRLCCPAGGGNVPSPPSTWAREKLIQQVNHLLEWKLRPGGPGALPRLHLVRVICAHVEPLFVDSDAVEDASHGLLETLRVELQALAQSDYSAGTVVVDCLLRLGLGCPKVASSCVEVLNYHLQRLSQAEDLSFAPACAAPLVDRAEQACNVLQSITALPSATLHATSAPAPTHSTKRSSLTGVELISLWSAPAGLPVEKDVLGIESWGFGTGQEGAAAALVKRLFAGDVFPPLEADLSDLDWTTPLQFSHDRDAAAEMLARIQLSLRRRDQEEDLTAPVSPALELEAKVAAMGGVSPVALNGGSDPVHVVAWHSVDGSRKNVIVHLRAYNATACPISEPLCFRASLSAGLSFPGGEPTSVSLGNRLLPGDCMSWDLPLHVTSLSDSPGSGELFVQVSMEIPGLEVDDELEEDADSLLRGGDFLSRRKRSQGGGSAMENPLEGGGGSTSTAILTCGQYHIMKVELLSPAPPEMRRLAGFRGLFSRLPCTAFIPVALAQWAIPLACGASAVRGIMRELGGAGIPTSSAVELPLALQVPSNDISLFCAWSLVSPCGVQVAAQLSCIKRVAQPSLWESKAQQSWHGRLELRCSSHKALDALLVGSGKAGVISILTGGVFEMDSQVTAFDSASCTLAGRKVAHTYRGGEEARARILPQWLSLKNKQ